MDGIGMSDDNTEQLIVQLEAKVDNFEKQMKKAAQVADQGFGSIETRAKQTADLISKNLESAANGVGGIFSKISGSFLGAAGITGLGVSALLSTLVNINGELAKLPGLARTAELSTDKLQEIKFAANLGGLSDSDFATGLKSAVAMLDEAQRQTNSLTRLFNANGLSIRDQNGQLKNFDQLLMDAARLMQNARTEQEKIDVARMIGLTDQWVGVLRKGPAALKEVEDSAKDAGAVIDKGLLDQAKEFDKQWNQAIVKFKAGFVGALADIASGFGEFWEKLLDAVPGASFIQQKLREMFPPAIADMTLPELQKALANNIRMGIGGADYKLIQAEIDARMKDLKVPGTSLTVNGPAPAEGSDNPTVIPKEKEKNTFDRAVEETNKRIAATEAETKTIGLNTEARERAKTVADLETAAKKANIDAGFQSETVTDAQRVKINQLADAMEAVQKKQRETQQGWQSVQSAAQFAGNEMVEVFDRLIQGSATFASSMQMVAQAIEKALLQAALLGSGPLAGLFGTANSAGGTGGIFGALLSALKPGPAAADGGIITGPGTGRSDSILAAIMHDVVHCLPIC
jgi:hypothetical protein